MSLEDSLLLIEDSKRILEEITNIHNRDIVSGHDSPLLRIRIKQYLENINSALDYAAFYIFKKYCAEHIMKEEPDKYSFRESRVYFPCLDDRKKFDNYINDRFKYLREEHEELVNILARFQPFPARSKWLKNLKLLVNDNKHRELMQQKKQHRTEINKLTASNNSSISNLTIISENGILPFVFVNEDGSKAKVTSFDGQVKYEFIFPELKEPVLLVLERIMKSAPTVIENIQSYSEGM